MKLRIKLRKLIKTVTLFIKRVIKQIKKYKEILNDWWWIYK